MDFHVCKDSLVLLITSSSSTKFQGPRSIPDYWDPAALPDPGFKVWDSRTLELDRGDL